MSDIKRQIAYKCSIKQVVESKYVIQQGLVPNYLDLGGLRVARLNLMGVLVSKEGFNLVLDDGSAQVKVVLFEDHHKSLPLKIGDLLLLIGKPREFNEKRFFVPEIIKVLNDAKWLELRKFELSVIDFPVKIDLVKFEEEFVEVSPENFSGVIMDLIKKLDKGQGAPYETVVRMSRVKDAEKFIDDLIKEGEIFEVKGMLKIL